MFSRYGPALVAATVTAILAPAGLSHAQGLFDFLFKPQAPSVRSYAPASPSPIFGGSPDGSAPASVAPRISGTGRYSSYCVRLCDGRYYPIQRSGSAQAGELCSLLCPASKTRIFSGSEIGSAAASDGSRYSSLENAFVYREKVVDGCTCNGTDAFGLARIDVADDPTLRKGDMIATAKGLEKYNGPSRAMAAASNRANASDGPLLSTGIRGAVDTGERSPERRVKRRTIFSINSGR